MTLPHERGDLRQRSEPAKLAARSERGGELSTTPVERTTASHAVTVKSVRQRPAWQRYGLAIGATAVALAVSVVLQAYIARVVFVLFWPAILIAAAFAGLGPGLLASTLAVVAVDWLFLEPTGSLSANSQDLVPLLIFFACAALVSSVANRRRMAEVRAAAAARDNAELATQIEEQAIELESQLEESRALAEELEQTTAHLEEQTEAAESANRFSRNMLESIVDPFVVQDAQWRFRYINDTAARIFAASGHGGAQSLVGRAVWDVYPQLIGTTFEREMRRAMKERVPVQFEAFYAEAGTWSSMAFFHHEHRHVERGDWNRRLPIPG